MQNLRIPITAAQGRRLRSSPPEKYLLPEDLIDKYDLKRPCPDFRRVVFEEPDSRTTIFSFEGIDKPEFLVRLGDQPLKIHTNDRR